MSDLEAIAGVIGMYQALPKKHGYNHEHELPIDLHEVQFVEDIGVYSDQHISE